MKSSNTQRALLRQAATVAFGLALLMLAASDLAAQQTNTFPLDGNAGVGTLTPTQPLEVVGSIVTSGNQTVTVTNKGVIEVTNTITNNALAAAAFKARHVFNGSGDNPSGADIVPTFVPTANLTLARGMVVGGRFAPPSGVTIANVYGANAVTWYDVASGSVTAGTTFFASSPIVWGALKPTTQYGLRVANQGISGTTNSYGLYVDTQSGSTNNYAAIFAGGNVGIGTTAPGAKLTVSKNSITPQVGSFLVSIVGAEGEQEGINVHTFGNSASHILRRANTSAASPSAIQLNDTIGVIGASGYGATAYSSTRARIGFAASQNWTDTAQGTYITFNTTANGTATVPGVERMRIDNAGNVGIGMTSPAVRLQLASSSANLTPASLVAADIGLAIQNTDTTAGNIEALSFVNSSGSGQAQIGTINLGSNAAAGGRLFFTTRAAGGNFSERMRIDENGNVGIGTASPSSILDLVRNQNGNTFVRIANNDSGATGKAYFVADNGTSSFRMQQNGAGFGGAGATLAGEGVLYNTSPALTLMTDNAAGIIKFATGGTGEKMRLDATGKLGIGKPDPGYSLDVAGTVNATEFKIAGSVVTSSQWTSDSGNINYTSGNVGIGVTGPPAEKLVVVGNIRATGTINAVGGLNIDGIAVTSSQWSAAGTNNINYTPAGNVGIGNATPTSKLDVTGNTNITGNITVGGTGNITAAGTIEAGNIKAKYQDVAEWVPSSEQLSAGTVVVLDQTKSNQVISSTVSYDTRVAGVISEQPGITLGESGAGKVLVATTGRVRVKVDATRAPIQIGDLLVTGDTPGVAMKSEPIELGGRQMHMPGTLIGKALEPLAKGKGEILVLLSLQ